jgi:hypothetical protein
MIVLTEPELIALTGSDKPLLQRRELDHMKIPYFKRRDGSVVVRRIDAEAPEHCPCNGAASTPGNAYSPAGARLLREPQVQP